ncbi:reverse transcriptase [Gossypium australe]|uniref:Reverse transcriptase n=1 Tax=Gossypium australe TaxID=47621 RepID=A0A5B6UKM8_9ROSI|nr:reverse transcriptase [Gossypium australe]
MGDSVGDNTERSVKKVRRRPDEPPDSDDLVVNDMGMKVDSSTNPAMSWILTSRRRILRKKMILNFLRVMPKRRLLMVSLLLHSQNRQFGGTKQALQVIDLDNDYFSVKFQNDEDYLEALLGGPWTIFGHYLIVRPWTLAFTTDQDHPNNLMVWIRLPGLPEESTQIHRKRNWACCAKIDRNTDNCTRGQFSRLAMHIDLGKLLVSKVNIDGNIQRVEYESPSLVCFECGRFGHTLDSCPQIVQPEDVPKRTSDGNHGKGASTQGRANEE